MATVVHINPDEPRVELLDDVLHVHEARLAGTIVEVATDLGLGEDQTRLSRLLADAAEIGATILRNGQGQALVDAVALEIDRLIETTSDESEKVPEALKQPLADHLQHLSDLLAENFDPKRARSLQRQLPAIVGEATGAELRRLVQDVLSESGAVGGQLKLFSHATTDMLTRVNTLLNRIEQTLQLDDQVERSVHKGRPFEEVVQGELQAIHGPLGDTVRCVRADYGLLPRGGRGAKAGDFAVAINPEHTRGREVCYVIEAKTGKLSHAEAQKALEAAMKNRGTTVGVLVFDDVADTPCGRAYLEHPEGRFNVVLDVANGDTVPFEVACLEARKRALASIDADESVDGAWLRSQCALVCEKVEAASAMLRNVSTVERSAGEIRNYYTSMRRDILELMDDVRDRTA